MKPTMKPIKMTLKKLIAETPSAQLVQGDAEIEAIAYDSRQVRAGTLFVAMGGVGHDALAYLGDALERGAAAVLAPVPPPAGVRLPWAISEHPRLALAELAAAWYGHPARKLRLIGITGTNGKTSVSHLVTAILKAAKIPTAQLGTTGYYLGEEWSEADWTTPEPLTLHRLFAAAVERGLTHVVMEVTSHALDQERTAGLTFAAAGFTNLTPEHLDYHLRIEGYFATKSRLFKQLEPQATALLNLDDPWVRRTELPTGRRLTYGLGEDADLRAEEVRFAERGLSLIVIERQDQGEGRLKITAPLVGEYDIYNILLAVGLTRRLGVGDEAIARGLSELPQIPGRFHYVDVPAEFEVVVDYAHTPDGLEKALTAARRLCPGRVIIVFGSAGERDDKKRPEMGRVAGELADIVVLTTEDPRSEAPAFIARRIASGVAADSCELHTVLDRREAVHFALKLAQSGDMVMVAGKGDENRMKYADHVEQSNDIELCRSYFSAP